MGFNAASFLGGLGTGALTQYQRQQEVDRQARVDDIYAKTAALQQEEAQGRINDQELARSDIKAQRAALAPATVNSNAATLDSGDGPKVYDFGSDSSNIAGSNAVQDKRLAALPANTPAPDAAAPAAGPLTSAAGAALPSLAAPQINQTTAVNGAAYADPAAGLKAATNYNDPVEQAKRYVSTLRAQGKVTEANAQELAITTHQNAVYNAQRDMVWQKANEAYSKGGVQSLLDMYNQHYNDGVQASFTPDPKGGAGGVISYVKDGKPFGAPTPITSPDQALDGVYSRLYPDKVQASRIATAQKVAEEKSKSHVMRPGDVIGSESSGVTKNDDLKPGYTWEVDTAGNRYQKFTGGNSASNATSKEWHDAGVAAERYFAVGEPDINGKYQSSPSLQTLFTTFQGDLRAQGKDPWDANSALASTLHQVRAAAEQDVAAAKQQDKKSTLTLEQALSNRVSAIFKNRDAALAAQKNAQLKVPGAPAAAAPAANKAPAAAANQAAPTAQPAPAAAPKAPAPAQSPVSPADPMAAKLAFENTEIMNGRMGAHTPEVKSYLVAKLAADKAADQAKQDALNKAESIKRTQRMPVVTR